MPDQAPTTVKVQYRHRDGYHIFTSDQVFGLYVATKDAEHAIKLLQPSLETLLDKNYSIKCKLEMAADFCEFVAHHQNSRRDDRMLADRTYVVRAA
jgi:hypothetical protein